jgi:hypothetical protein
MRGHIMLYFRHLANLPKFKMKSTRKDLNSLREPACHGFRYYCLLFARLFEWNDVVVVLEQIRNVCLSPGKDTEETRIFHLNPINYRRENKQRFHEILKHFQLTRSTQFVKESSQYQNEVHRPRIPFGFGRRFRPCHAEGFHHHFGFCLRG